jgi:dihydrofolate synthase/folylpolyglutamate synthase
VRPDLAFGAPDDYRRALAALFQRTTGVWRLGLERVGAFLQAEGDPHRRYPVFHVAGTNGKGSVVATLDSLLRAHGLRVGRYTSPHLVDFRERIVVDGVPMPPEAIVEWLARTAPLVERLGSTFFEVTTAMAFDWFARAEVDVAIIEVGMGGRLDATNVVQPVCAGVTSIGLDHQEYLGQTLELISAEKGGVFKAGAGAVIGDRQPAVQAVLAACAQRAGSAPLLVASTDFGVSEVQVNARGTRFIHWSSADASRSLHTALVGVYQADNTAVALAMLRAAGPDWAGALARAESVLPTVRLAGRFQRVGRWIFDVAHNPAGARTVGATLAAAPVPRPLWALVTVLQDKDWRGILEALAPHVDGFVVTAAPTAPASRRWDPVEAAGVAEATGRAVVLEPAFDRAIARALAEAETVLATGSFHTVGDVMAHLGIDPLQLPAPHD